MLDRDADGLESRMERVLVRRLALWPNRIRSMEAPASEFVHRNIGRCICDDCSAKRPQAKLGEPSPKRTKDTGFRPTPQGEPPRPRFEDGGMNKPVAMRASSLDVALAAMRASDPRPYKCPKTQAKPAPAPEVRLIKKGCV